MATSNRRFPEKKLMNAMHKFVKMNYSIVLIGSRAERTRTFHIQNKWGSRAFSFTGKLSPEEFMMLVSISPFISYKRGHDYGSAGTNLHLFGLKDGASVSQKNKFNNSI